jgi:hypothetical protein
MYQSSTRNNFLDILLDPMAIAILGSIVLHATIGASLPFFTHPEKDSKKAGPGTVKVVELTPNELQRIPQVQPTPTSQVLPPVTQSITPSPSVAQSSTPQISTNTKTTIPFSPIRIPLEKVMPKKPTGNKEQAAIPQKQPTAPIFDPNIIFKPNPKPSKLPDRTGVTPKPSIQPSPKSTPPPQSTPPTDDDGTDPSTQSTQPNRQAQTTATPQPSATPRSQTPQPAVTPQPSSAPTSGSGNNSGFYGKYTDAALQQLSQYMREYDVKEPYASKLVIRSYPQGMLCSKEKQAPFIVMMAVFDKVTIDPNADILGDQTPPSLKISTFKDRDTPEQRTLAEIATRVALEEANKADQNRPEKDKGKRVIYQYRVQFDPATCKK